MKIIKQLLMAALLMGTSVPSVLVAWGEGVPGVTDRSTLEEKKNDLRVRIGALTGSAKITADKRDELLTAVAGTVQKDTKDADELLRLHATLNALDAELHRIDALEIKGQVAFDDAAGQQPEYPEAHKYVPVDEQAAALKRLSDQKTALSAQPSSVPSSSAQPSSASSVDSSKPKEKIGLCRLMTYLLAAGIIAGPLSVIYALGPWSSLYTDTLRQCGLFLAKVPLVSRYMTPLPEACSTVWNFLPGTVVRATGWGAAALGSAFVAFRKGKDLINRCRSGCRGLVS